MELEEKIIELLRETNMFYDLNYDDVAFWINENKEALIKLLQEVNTTK